MKNIGLFFVFLFFIVLAAPFVLAVELPKVIISSPSSITSVTTIYIINGTNVTHNVLADVQGGNPPTDAYHLTAAEWANRIFLLNQTSSLMAAFQQYWYNQTTGAISIGDGRYWNASLGSYNATYDALVAGTDTFALNFSARFINISVNDTDLLDGYHFDANWNSTFNLTYSLYNDTYNNTYNSFFLNGTFNASYDVLVGSVDTFATNMTAIGINFTNINITNVTGQSALFRGYFDYSAMGLESVRMGVAGGSPRIVFEKSNNPWTIDNAGDTLRFFKQAGLLNVQMRINTTDIQIGTDNDKVDLMVYGLGWFNNTVTASNFSGSLNCSDIIGSSSDLCTLVASATNETYRTVDNFTDLFRYSDWNATNTSYRTIYNNTFSGDVLPDTTLFYDLGSGASRWAYLYVANISAENIDTYNVAALYNVSAGVFLGNTSCANITGAVSDLCTITPFGNEVDPVWDGNSSVVLGNITRYDFFYRTNQTINWTLNAYNMIIGNLSDKTNGSYVPYTGAINNVELGKYNLTAKWLSGKIDCSNITGAASDLCTITTTGGDTFASNYTAIFINISVNNSDLLDGKHYDDNWNSTFNFTYSLYNDTFNATYDNFVRNGFNVTNDTYVDINNITANINWTNITWNNWGKWFYNMTEGAMTYINNILLTNSTFGTDTFLANYSARYINISVNNSDLLDGYHFDLNWNSTYNLTYALYNDTFNFTYSLYNDTYNNTYNSVFFNGTYNITYSLYNDTYNNSYNSAFLNGTFNLTYALFNDTFNFTYSLYNDTFNYSYDRGIIKDFTNVAWTNQSNNFSMNQFINANLTADWFFGKVNWSNLQNINESMFNSSYRTVDNFTGINSSYNNTYNSFFLNGTYNITYSLYNDSANASYITIDNATANKNWTLSYNWTLAYNWTLSFNWSKIILDIGSVLFWNSSSGSYNATYALYNDTFNATYDNFVSNPWNSTNMSYRTVDNFTGIFIPSMFNVTNMTYRTVDNFTGLFTPSMFNVTNQTYIEINNISVNEIINRNQTSASLDIASLLFWNISLGSYNATYDSNIDTFNGANYTNITEWIMQWQLNQTNYTQLWNEAKNHSTFNNTYNSVFLNGTYNVTYDLKVDTFSGTNFTNISNMLSRIQNNLTIMILNNSINWTYLADNEWLNNATNNKNWTQDMINGYGNIIKNHTSILETKYNGLWINHTSAMETIYRGLLINHTLKTFTELGVKGGYNRTVLAIQNITGLKESLLIDQEVNTTSNVLFARINNTGYSQFTTANFSSTVVIANDTALIMNLTKIGMGCMYWNGSTMISEVPCTQ